MKMEQSVPKRRHLNSRRRVITQKKAYNIQNTAKAWNQEVDITQLLVRLNSTTILFSIGINKYDMGKEKKSLQFHL